MTIGEIAAKTNLTESALRYYEKKGLVRVARDQGGRRDYAEGDVEWIRFIQRLKETGMQLADIRRYSELRYQGGSTMPERMEMLQRHREYVAAQQRKWQEYMQNLNDKIAFYQESIQENR